MTTQQRLREFIDQYLLDEPFPGEDPLAESDMDSLAIEQIIDFAEEEFGVLFQEEDIVAENFSSLPVLAALIDGKRAAAG